MLILGFNHNASQTRLLAQQLNTNYDVISVHQFPDGESCVKIPVNLPPVVAFLISLDHPNNKLIELLLAVESARQHGCRRAILVTPYLCYMRQDKEFEPGQAISQVIIGEWLSRHFDAVITVDPHLHRISKLSEALPNCHAISLSAAGLIGEHLANEKHSILIGPDEESEQWVSVAAETSHLPYCIAKKTRHGDRDVSIELPEQSLKGKKAILLDDVISSGHTMKEAAIALLERGCAQVDAVCTHALFAAGAESALTKAGISQIISCNSIAHNSNRIDLSPLLAKALLSIL